ncbi:MAG: serine--tRNA ligase [Candidatus Nitronauta litoralis]|uniref:Serine--tRNA ligase n=1 Tax=Candidatus Nitronauta litoralis TaxID=2705533 RepID=A0A7T0BVA1_9BACT|nr:MAG: serine--tRNA ligase [Candidatus Nitronauta litoralis]
MLDIKKIRENPEEFRDLLKKRGTGVAEEIELLLEKDRKRREGIQHAEQLKNKKKTLSQEVGKLKQKGEDATSLMEEVKQINEEIKRYDDTAEENEQALQEHLLAIPNTPHDSVPKGENEDANELVREWGTPGKFDFEVRNHVELGEALDILDQKRAVKISASRFAVFKKEGARLLRALIQFMLDVQTEENGYGEISPPFLVNRESMIGTGQFPKFEEDQFRLADDPLFLIPTAEVPLTNLHRDEILEEDSLPLCYAAYTACFRREAGSYGKDTQGIIRQHQFDKVELVKFCKPENSFEELEKLVKDAESILQKLDLPYRVMNLCTGDLGFSSTKTYDLEVWLPSQKMYREISSCSNFVDYQARRAKIRFRRGGAKGKPELVHTLNGSGLAAGRLWVAVLENYQQEDGSIQIPAPLQSYMGGREKIGPA